MNPYYNINQEEANNNNNKTFNLFPHQEEGLRWMIQKELSTLKGGLLCDDPGLGKTIQILSLIKERTNNYQNEHNLIICPLALIKQWKDASTAMFPEKTIHIHYEHNKINNTQHFYTINPFITITTFNNTWKSHNKQFAKTILHNIQWTRIITDEAQTIKNIKSKVAIGCHLINAQYRWALTGTPIQNNIKDIHALFYYIHAYNSDIQLIKTYTQELILNGVLRRTRHIMEHAYKNLTIKIHQAHFDNIEEKEFYYTIKKAIAQEFYNLNEHSKDYITQVLELLLRLRQTTIHPNIVYEGLMRKVANNKEYNQETKLKYMKQIATQIRYWANKTSTKINTLINLFKTHNEKDKTIIFTHFNEETNLIHKNLNKQFPHMKIQIYDGNTTYSQRNHIIQLCKNNKVDTIIIQIMAGGVGLNLQMFNKVYITSPDWNPANEIQAIARCHRIGQLQNVEVHKIIISDPLNYHTQTIDERIIHIQQDKREVMANTLQDQTLLFNEINTHNNEIFKNTQKTFKTLLTDEI